MAPAFAGGRVASIVGIFAAGFRFTQLCFDLDFNGAGEMVMQNFVLMDTCFKLFITAYRQVHAEEVGMLAFSCLIGLSIHLCTIVIHLYINHTSLARAWISSMAILVSAGAFMLAMKIPDDYAWHGPAVEAILDLFICLDAALLVISKVKYPGANENLVRDLLMILAETLVAVCLFTDYLGEPRSPWDAEKILHMFGSCLVVLIGFSHMFWIVYKAYAHGVCAGAEEHAAGAAMEGGDVEQQRV